MLLVACIAGAGQYLLFDVAEVGFWEKATDELRRETGLGTVTVSLDDFQHRTGQDEIWVAGKLYDIGSYRIKGNRVVISVFHDSDEERAIYKLTGLLDGSNFSPAGSNDVKFKSVQTLPEPIFPPTSAINIGELVFQNDAGFLVPRSVAFIMEHPAPVKSPPPKHTFC